MLVSDSVNWKNSNEGFFSMKSMYNALFKEITKKKMENSLSTKV